MHIVIVIVIVIILINVILLINYPICWKRGEPFKLIDAASNGIYKMRHTYLNIPLNKKICQENLEILHKILNKERIEFWLSEGTALGAYRDSDFIDHDDDVDVGIWNSDFKSFKNKVYPELIKEGFRLDFNDFNNTFWCFSRKGEKVDIDFTGKGLECMACKTKRANCKSCNEMIPYLKEMKYIEFHGKQYLCPTEHYFEYLYGKSWKTPLKEKYKNTR